MLDLSLLSSSALILVSRSDITPIKSHIRVCVVIFSSGHIEKPAANAAAVGVSLWLRAFDTSCINEAKLSDFFIVLSSHGGTRECFVQHLSMVSLKNKALAFLSGISVAVSASLCATPNASAEVTVNSNSSSVNVSEGHAWPDGYVGDAETKGIWDNVLKVLGSQVECQFIRTVIKYRYPFTVCIPNPDKNGTWLLIIKWP